MYNLQSSSVAAAFVEGVFLNPVVISGFTCRASASCEMHGVYVWCLYGYGYGITIYDRDCTAQCLFGYNSVKGLGVGQQTLIPCICKGKS